MRINGNRRENSKNSIHRQNDMSGILVFIDGEGYT